MQKVKHPQWLTRILSIFNNLSRYHLSSIRFLVEKFHTEVVVWLITSMLDQKNVDLISIQSNGKKNFEYVNQALEFVGNISSESQTLLMSKIIEYDILSKL